MNSTWTPPLIAYGNDARALSEAELRAIDAQLAWAFANCNPSWVGRENYRLPAAPTPALPVGWADWYKIGDELQ